MSHDAGKAAVVLVACGRDPYALLLPANVDLGRQIVADGTTYDLDDERMSREHARVRHEQGAWIVTDRNSRNGTFLDGERVAGTRQTRGTAVLRIGHSLFVLLADATGHPTPLGTPLAGDVTGPELAAAFATLQSYGARGEDVLLDAEAGNAKLRAARAYHAASPRREGPFIAVNCGALPEGMGERLLFGARNATFANATRSIGHLQLADGGTLFLDEVSDLDDTAQQRLLRVIQTRELVPVGAPSGTRMDLAIVAASLHDLQLAQGDGRVRPELFAALTRDIVRLPPLRERKLDIARIVQRECARAELAPHAKLVESCCIRPWPGNERELESAIQQAIAAARADDRDLVRAENLAGTAGGAIDPNAGLTAVERKQPNVVLDRDAVVEALARANGVISIAARQLGLHRTELYRLMESHGLKSDPREEP